MHQILGVLIIVLPSIMYAQVVQPGGTGTVSGQASGVIPLGTAATTIGGQSHCNSRHLHRWWI